MRALDDQSKLDRYLELKGMISEMEEEMEILKPEILSALMDEPEGKYAHWGNDLSYYYRKTYEYTDKVKEMDKQLKAAQRYERDSGLAEIVKEQAVLVVRASKVEGVAVADDASDGLPF